MENFKVLSIVGYDRSGTTLLGRILAKSKEVIFLGEVDRGFKNFREGKKGICSCEKKLKNCSFWGKHIPEIIDKDYDFKIFQKITSSSGTKLIIDSSKSFRQIKNIARHYSDKHLLIFIKRNPKGVIYSRMRTRKRRVQNDDHPKKKIARHTNLLLIYDSIEWSLENLWLEIFTRNKNSISVNYEDLGEGLEKNIIPFIKENTAIDIELKDNSLNHIIDGNINRFNPVFLPIVIDDAWKKELNFIQKMIVDIITFPIRKMFNYNFRKK